MDKTRAMRKDDHLSTRSLVPIVLPAQAPFDLVLQAPLSGSHRLML